MFIFKGEIHFRYKSSRKGTKEKSIFHCVKNKDNQNQIIICHKYT